MSAYVKPVAVFAGFMAAVYGVMSALAPDPEELKKVSLTYTVTDTVRHRMQTYKL